MSTPTTPAGHPTVTLTYISGQPCTLDLDAIDCVTPDSGSSIVWTSSPPWGHRVLETCPEIGRRIDFVTGALSCRRKRT